METKTALKLRGVLRHGEDDLSRQQAEAEQTAAHLSRYTCCDFGETRAVANEYDYLLHRRNLLGWLYCTADSAHHEVVDMQT